MRGVQSSPRWWNETQWPSPTMRWSSSASVSRRAAVSCRSSVLGSGQPEGWLWALWSKIVMYLNFVTYCIQRRQSSGRAHNRVSSADYLPLLLGRQEIVMLERF